MKMEMEREPFKLSLFEIICLLFPLLFAPVAWLSDSRLVGASYGYASMPFELFGFFASLAVAGVCYLKLKRGYEPLRVLVFFALSSITLVLMVEHISPKWDYMCYERAARALISGEGVYASSLSHCYFYPPIYAQILAGAFRLLSAAGVADNKAWHIVYLFHYASQFYFVLIAWMMLSRMATVCGMDVAKAELVAALILAINTAFVRNLVFHQLNFTTLALALGAIWLASAAPAASGLLLATSIGLKLFPLFLLIPLLYARRYRAVVWSLVWGAAILAVSFALNGQVWFDYLGHTLPPDKPFYRNFSPVAIISNILGFVRPDARAHMDEVARAYGAMWFVASVAILLLLKPTRRRPDGIDEWGLYSFALAIAPLGSPQQWSHQMIMALPLTIWLLLTSERPYGILVPAALTFGFPVFDVFPFSYHRLAGILWLLALGYARLRKGRNRPRTDTEPKRPVADAKSDAPRDPF